MQINDWKDKISSYYKEKFPNQDWSMQDRMLSLISQVASLAEKVQFNQGLRNVDKQHQTEELLVITVLLDVFILCSKLNIDIDKSLEEILLDFNKVQR